MRLSGADLQKFQNSEAAFNAQYGASVKTEHAFNGLGILDKVWCATIDRGTAVIVTPLRLGTKNAGVIVGDPFSLVASRYVAPSRVKGGTLYVDFEPNVGGFVPQSGALLQ